MVSDEGAGANRVLGEAMTDGVHECCDCGKVGADVTYGPDPFAELYAVDGETPVWECAKCRLESEREI